MCKRKLFNKALCYITVLVAIAAFCSSASVEAANLHAVMVADTTDESIGNSTAVDLKNMRKEIQKIALYTGLNLKETTIDGKETVPGTVLKKINALKVDSEDIVIFYFSGHGYRTPSKGDNPWPNLYFSRVDQGIDYDFIGKKLEQYNPRFLLVISDVCNSMIPDDYAPPLISRMFFKAINEKAIEKNYRALFLDAKGTVLVTSSKAGEFSWGTDQGGLFTVSFLKHLNAAVESSLEPSWYTILDNTAAEVEADQHPDFRIWLN